MTGTHVDLVVVGGGITGLAAAWEAVQRGAEVVVLEADDRPGGKLRTSPVAGVGLDESADAFLARVPEAVDLCTELGLADELVAPATGRAYVWVDGKLRPLPEAQLLGVPTDVDAVAATGILSPPAIAHLRRAVDRRAIDRSEPAPEHGSTRPPSGAGSPGSGDSDESVGALVRRELGDEVLDRLVAPLVGGIWAGDCDRLSLRVATPALAEAWSRGPSLVGGAAAIRAAALAAAAAQGPDMPGSGHQPRPVFLAPRGGMGRLVEALAAALGDRLHVGHPATSIERVPPGEPGRWRVNVAVLPGHTADRADHGLPVPHGASAAGASRRGTPPVTTGSGFTTDAVVVTTPAFAAAPLVAPLSPRAAATLAAIEYASVALVTMAVPRDGIERPLDGSGFLVPPSAGRLLTACSWASSKWPHLTAGDQSVVLLRASAGRDGDDRALALDDTKLLDALLADLADTTGLRAAPIDVRISRWWRSFPQPRPEHLDRIAALEADLARDAPGVLAAGAWARGVGLPACIRAGRAAARAALSL